MAIINLIKPFSERLAEAKETPYTPLYKKIKIKFVRYRRVLAPPQRCEKEKYISYNGQRTCEVRGEADHLGEAKRNRMSAVMCSAPTHSLPSLSFTIDRHSKE